MRSRRRNLSIRQEGIIGVNYAGAAGLTIEGSIFAGFVFGSLPQKVRYPELKRQAGRECVGAFDQRTVLKIKERNHVYDRYNI